MQTLAESRPTVLQYPARTHASPVLSSCTLMRNKLTFSCVYEGGGGVWSARRYSIAYRDDVVLLPCQAGSALIRACQVSVYDILYPYCMLYAA